jgi:hypothetical protein
MKKEGHCSIFSISEIAALRKVPGAMKLIIALFLVIMGLMFTPMISISRLAEQVGEVSAILKERRATDLEFRERQRERLAALEKKTCLEPKKFYWINRNSREANEKIEDLRRLLEGAGCSQSFKFR